MLIEWYNIGMVKHKKDTSISLQPMTFEEAIAELANTVRQKDSQAEASDNAKTTVPPSAPPKRKTARRRKSSVG